MASSSKDKASIMERPIQLLKDIHHRKELWKIAAKVKDKWVIVKDGKQSFDMVVFDTKGDDIYVMVPNELYEKYGTTIVEKNTYTFQNFQVLNNDEQFKLSEHKYKLRLNGATIINDVNVHNIPDPRDVFSHGQVYLAVSRVKNKKGIKILIHDEKNLPKTSTTNVVYKEVFNNI